MLTISNEDGEQLVRLARKAVEKYLNESVILNLDDINHRFSQKAGVFVTLNYLNRNKEEHLRGCIGSPLPEKKLYQSVIEAAIAAATQDPRFPPVIKDELANIIFEVSVLTTPEEIRVQSPRDPSRYIRIGRDGLILRWKYGSGLLLPQVPVELKWDIDEYLANVCYKAGAPPDVWLLPESKLYRFEATVYKECDPNGRVVKVNLDSL
jgi:uncharacterized protein (TIGR00296 family)